MQMKTFINSFIIFTFLLLPAMNSQAQSSFKLKEMKKLFEGQWLNKKTTRQLQISFEYDKYATITDWTEKFQRRESGDVYKAFIKDGKLVMPEDKEHRAPYSEIISKNNVLIYRTKSVGTGKNSAWDQEIFKRHHSF